MHTAYVYSCVNTYSPRIHIHNLRIHNQKGDGLYLFWFSSTKTTKLNYYIQPADGAKIGHVLQKKISCEATLYRKKIFLLRVGRIMSPHFIHFFF